MNLLKAHHWTVCITDAWLKRSFRKASNLNCLNLRMVWGVCVSDLSSVHHLVDTSR